MISRQVHCLFLALCLVMPGFVRPFKMALLSGEGEYFDAITRGWYDECKAIGDNVTCENYTDLIHQLEELDLVHLYDRDRDKHSCITIIRWLIERGDVDAIAARCPYRRDMPLIFDQAKEAGIPVAVFGGPHEGMGEYDAFIGTDQEHLGRTIARLLKQLRPEGGTYLATYNDATSAERFHGFKDEIESDNNRDDKPHWYEAPINYTEIGPPTQDTPLCYIGPYPGWDGCGYRGVTRLGYAGIPWFLEKFHEVDPTAIVFLYQFPMRHENYTHIVEKYRYKNVSYLGVDGTADNLNYMVNNYVDGLVGEQTYIMGKLSARTLYRLLMGDKNVPKKTTTKLINYNLVPEELPPLVVDQSLLGDLKYAGYICFGIIAIGVVICIGWTVLNQSSVVVKASQPIFLGMTASGVLIMASTLIPLSFDDGGVEISDAHATGICMSIPWLGFLGFAITFSAVYVKTWRVNQFFKSSNVYGRIRVQRMEVLIPFAVIFTLNTLFLLCWTLIDPLMYVRTFTDGTDLWNREIASIGVCRSVNVVPYVVPLGLINLAVLATACWQAYEARDIESEFAEAKWIAMTVFSLTQGFLTGLPIVAVASDNPETFYLILTFLIFGVCLVVLSLIFIPKMIMERRYRKMTDAERRKAMLASVRRSARMPEESPGLQSAAFRNAARTGAMQASDEVPESHSSPSAQTPSNADSSNSSAMFVAKPAGRRMFTSYVEEDALKQEEEEVHST